VFSVYLIGFSLDMCTNIYYCSMCIFQEISFSCVLYNDVSFPMYQYVVEYISF
jgi:hypothetical protein